MNDQDVKILETIIFTTNPSIYIIKITNKSGLIAFRIGPSVKKETTTELERHIVRTGTTFPRLAGFLMMPGYPKPKYKTGDWFKLS